MSSRRLTFIYSAALLAIVLFAFAPLIAALGSALIAEHAGCDLDEGSVHACIVLGRDIGETLYTFFVAGWFGLLTMPAGASLLLGWIIILCIHLLARRLHRRR